MKVEAQNPSRVQSQSQSQSQSTPSGSASASASASRSQPLEQLLTALAPLQFPFDDGSGDGSGGSSLHLLPSNEDADKALLDLNLNLSTSSSSSASPSPSASSSSASNSSWRELTLNVLNYVTMYQSSSILPFVTVPSKNDSNNNTNTNTNTNTNVVPNANEGTNTKINESKSDSQHQQQKQQQQQPLITMAQLSDLMMERSNEASTFIMEALARYKQAKDGGKDHDKDDDVIMSEVQKNEISPANNRNNNGDNDGLSDDCDYQSGEYDPEDILIDGLWLVSSIIPPVLASPQPPTKQQQQQQQKDQDGKMDQNNKDYNDKNSSSNNNNYIHDTEALTSIQNSALCHFIQTLYNNNILSRKKLFTRLEPGLVTALKGIAPRTSKELFLKRLKKTNTDYFYRQKRYNLFAEESEGYAKFLSFLCGGMLMIQKNGIDEDDNVEKDHESVGIEAKIESVKLQVTEYIGTFDLDPNRCLDITIDLLEYQIRSLLSQLPSQSFDSLRHAPEHAFCISLLLGIISMFPKSNVTHLIGFKYSSYKTAADTSSNDTNNKDKDKDKNSKNKSSDAEKKNSNGTTSTNTTNTSTATGAAKKDEPTLHAVVNANVTAPKSLHFTTAILAAHEYISLSVLAPHLSPSLPSIKDQYIVWKNNYTSLIKKISSNKLSEQDKRGNFGTKWEWLDTRVRSASAETTDSTTATVGTSTTTTTTTTTVPPSHDCIIEMFCQGNQFIQLLNVMIEICLPWEMICSLFQSPPSSDEYVDADEAVKVACSIYEPLAKNLCKYVNNLIDRLYKVKVKQNELELVSCNNKRNDSGKEHHNPSSLSSFGKYTLLPAKLTHDVALSETTTLLHLCDSLKKPLAPIIATGCIASDPILFCKICRLFRVLLEEELSKIESDVKGRSDSRTDDQILSIVQKKSISTILQEFIISSLSLFPFNPAIGSEVWNTVSFLPYQIRYSLYTLWQKDGLDKAALRSVGNAVLFSPKPLKQIESEIQTSVKIKYVLRRLSQDNVKDMGKQISKIAHNNPLVVFNLILNQIESYDNLILMMVDVFKFMGKLSLDVMGYYLLASLGGGEKGETRKKLKGDGVNVAQWLSSLETFTGAFYKKFTDVEIGGLLAYFTKRLYGGQTVELGVLRSLLKMAGGYGFVDSESTASLSQLQLEGRCGSLMLRRQTSDFGVVEAVNVGSSRRLRAALQSDACGVIFLILLSQLRAKALFDSPNKTQKIKLLGNLYDTCQRTLNTLLAFLTDGSEDVRCASSDSNVGAIARYANSLPTLGDLCEDFGLSPATAWMLCRPLLRAAMLLAEDAAQNTKVVSKDLHGVMNLPAYLKPFHPSSDEVKIRCKQMIPSSDWKHITPLVYRRFFAYHISDLNCPEERYKTEISRIRKEIDPLVQLQKGGREAAGIHASLSAKAAAAGATYREIKEATAFTEQHQRDLDRLNHSANTLSMDLERQKKHCKSVHDKLQGEKNNFFANLVGEDGKIMTASVFLSRCIYPRALQSAEDAMYSARFIELLNELATPRFHTLELFDGAVNAVVGALYSITEDEAGCLGIFFEKIWSLISDWRYDESKYNSTLSEKPGSVWIKQSVNDGQEEKNDSNSYHLSHAEYIEVYNRWHFRLGTAFIGCLNSKEYMHNRTGLILLMRMVTHFPTKSILGEKILNTLKPLQEDSNPMQDIKTMAQAYSSKLTNARNVGVWKEESKKATEERAEREKKIQEEKKLQLKKNYDQFKEDNEKISSKLGDNWDSRDRRRQDRPPAHVPPQQLRMADRGPNLSTHVRDHRNQRPAQHDRVGSRWERDKVQRPHDQVRRRDDNRDNHHQSGSNEGGSSNSLQGRWEGNHGGGSIEARKSKRDRSPENRGAKSSRGSSLDRDAKRPRRDVRDVSPPRNPRRRR